MTLVKLSLFLVLWNTLKFIYCSQHGQSSSFIPCSLLIESFRNLSGYFVHPNTIHCLPAFFVNIFIKFIIKITIHQGFAVRHPSVLLKLLLQLTSHKPLCQFHLNFTGMFLCWSPLKELHSMKNCGCQANERKHFNIFF
jgi:hypothetical protein